MEEIIPSSIIFLSSSMGKKTKDLPLLFEPSACYSNSFAIMQSYEPCHSLNSCCFRVIFHKYVSCIVGKRRKRRSEPNPLAGSFECLI